MAIITIPGRAGIARSIRSNQLFIAWGTGSEEWTGSQNIANTEPETNPIPKTTYIATIQEQSLHLSNIPDAELTGNDSISPS